MRTKTLLAIIATAALVNTSQVRAAATTSPSEVVRTAQLIDQLTKPGDMLRVDRNGRSTKRKAPPVDVRMFVPVLSHMMHVNDGKVREALVYKQVPLSNVVFAGMLAERTGRDFESLITQKPASQWIDEFGKARVPLDEVQERIDAYYAELAFVSLNRFPLPRVAGPVTR